MTAEQVKKEKKSLQDRMSCDKHDCDNGLHCFRITLRKNAKAAKPKGACQACGAEGLVNWDAANKRDPNQIEQTIADLKQEGVRHDYWCTVVLSERAIIHARKKGRAKMREAVEKRMMSCIGKAKTFREGHTPWDGPNSIFYAQHATATCCRRCIEYWHGIERGRDLTNEEFTYITTLVMRYIEEKINLTEDGESEREVRASLASSPSKNGSK